MSTVTIDSSVLLTSDKWAHPRNVVVKDSNTAYVFGVDNSAAGASYWKTSDRGQTWAGPTTWDTTNTTTACTVYYEKWNGPSGRAVVHMLRFRDEGARGLYYRQLDLSTDTLSTEVLVQSSSGAPVARCTLAVSRDNSLIMAFGGSWGATSSHKSRKSTDDGATWSDAVSIQIASGFTEYELWPDFNSSDPQDMSVILWTNNATDDFVLRQVDVSTDSVAQTNISTTNTATGINTDWSATLAPNGDIYFAFWDKNACDGTSNELKTYRISGNTITQKTSILTATTYAFGVALTTITGYGVVAHYRRDSGAASASSLEVYYKISTDGMTTWGTEQTFDSTGSAAGMVLAPPVVPGGELALAVWLDGTATSKNLLSAYPPTIDTTSTPPVTGTIPPTDSNGGGSTVLEAPPIGTGDIEVNESDEADQTLDSNPSDDKLLDSNTSDDAGLNV